MAEKGKYYRIYEMPCEVCGAEFRRSALIDNPPRFCSQACHKKAFVGVKYVRYVVAERWLPVIRDLYAKGVGQGEVSALAAKIGVPRTKITNIARENGWIQRKRSADYKYYWSEEELAIVAALPDHSAQAVHKRLKKAGFVRSVSAVEVKRTELRVVQNRKSMSAYELALCLGLHHKTVTRMIHLGRLSAKRRPGYFGPTASYMLRPRDVRNFILENLPEIDLSKVDRYWFVDLLVNGAPEDA